VFNERKPLTFGISEEDAVIGGSEYMGDLPPVRKPLSGEITKIYVDMATNGNPMLKVLYRANVESGYDGFVAWDNVTLTAKAAFKWKPLVEALGVTVQDLASRTVTDESEESGAGTRVVRIGNLDLSGDNTVPVYFAVKYRKYDGLLQTDVIGVRARSLDGLSEFAPETSKPAEKPEDDLSQFED
jgi:hypothetical protein